MTDRHTHTQTHTHRHTDTKFFIALSHSATSITSRKVIKSGCIKILFFAWIQYFGILMRAEVKFGVRVSVCLCVCVSVCLSARFLHFFIILQRSRWCQNLCNFNTKSWIAFELSSVTVSWRAWQKRGTIITLNLFSIFRMQDFGFTPKIFGRKSSGCRKTTQGFSPNLSFALGSKSKTVRKALDLLPSTNLRKCTRE
jgi:hypothetical protein